MTAKVIVPIAPAVSACSAAVWARQADAMDWPSGTNIVLGATLLLVAAARGTIGVAPLVCFWIILLIGIAIAIAAMWSMLYRPATARTAASS